MLTKPANWDTYLADANHYYETVLRVGSTEYTHDNIMSLSSSQNLYGDEYSVGGVCMNQWDATLYNVTADAIPKFSKVSVWTRLCAKGAFVDSTKTSHSATLEWGFGGGVYVAYADSITVKDGKAYLVNPREWDWEDDSDFIGKYWTADVSLMGEMPVKCECKYYDVTAGTFSYVVGDESLTITVTTCGVNINPKTDYVPKGIFYTKQPSYDPESKLLTITGYDEMFRTEQIPFEMGTTFTFNEPTLREMALKIVNGTDTSGKIVYSGWSGCGIELEDSAQISNTITMSAQPFGYTVREILRDIAIASGGNWVVAFSGTYPTQTAKLRLVKTNVSQTFKGSVDLGRNVQSVEIGDDILAVDKVIINYGTASNGATLSQSYGTHSTGRIVELTVNTITDSTQVGYVASAVYNAYQNDTYHSIASSGTELPPIYELGDGVTVNSVTSVLGNMTTDFTKAMYTDIESVGITEEESFPYLSSIVDKTERDFAKAKASLTITATEIKSTVTGWTGINEWDSTTTYALNDTCYLNGIYYKSKVSGNLNHQPPNSAYWDVYSEASYVSSAISQSASSIKAEVYGTYAELYSSSAKYYVSDVVKYTVNNVTHFYKCIDVDDEYIQGIVPTNTDYWDDLGTSVTIQSLISMNLEGISISYSSSASDNSAYIKLNKDGVEIGGGTITMGNVVAESVSASWVYAGSIVGTQITADTLSVSQLSCKGTSDKITVKNADGTSTYGYIGCGTGSDGSSTTTGVFVGANSTHYLIPTTQGVRMQSGSNKFYISNDYTVFGSVCYGTLANRPAGTEGAIYFVVN